MWLLFFTPNKAKPLIIASITWFLLTPVSVALVFFFARGEAHVMAIGFHFAFWITVSWLFLFMLWVALKDFAGRVPLWSFNRSRPTWSVVWTAIAILAVAFCIIPILMFLDGLQVMSAYWLIGAWLIWNLRSVIVHQEDVNVDQLTSE